MSLMEDKVIEATLLIAATTNQREFELALSKLRNITREIAKIDVLSAFLRFEEFYTYLTLRVFIR